MEKRPILKEQQGAQWFIGKKDGGPRCKVSVAWELVIKKCSCSLCFSRSTLECTKVAFQRGVDVQIGVVGLGGGGMMGSCICCCAVEGCCNWKCSVAKEIVLVEGPVGLFGSPLTKGAGGRV